MKRALVTGINGMDGSHLADFLLKNNYEVFGMERRSSVKNRTNTKHLEGDIEFLTGDLTDQNSLFRTLRQVDPHEVYNLGSQSFVGESWNTPEQTGNVTGLGVLRVLEALREYDKPIKFYQASSSEMFGRMVENPANENTPFYPRSPYGVSKLYGHWITKNYRESYGMFNVSGVLFNHESERRGIEFVTRKISDGVARIHLGLEEHITLGNLDAKRDWGYAPDYVEAMWLMLQQPGPDDFVCATGVSHTVLELVKHVFKRLNLDWKKYVAQDKKFLRPEELEWLKGDSTKLREATGWQPTYTFESMVDEMVDHWVEIL